MHLKVIYLFYKSAETVTRDIIQRFVKAIFLLVVPVHTGNKVILRSQIVAVESPPLEKIDDVNQCESLLLERKFYSGVLSFKNDNSYQTRNEGRRSEGGSSDAVILSSCFKLVIGSLQSLC